MQSYLSDKVSKLLPKEKNAEKACSRAFFTKRTNRSTLPLMFIYIFSISVKLAIFLHPFWPVSRK
jgi:hypothetical protein